VTSAAETKRSRSGKRATVKRHADDALATLKFSAIAESQSHVEEFARDTSKVELGIAFVAGALGKKMPTVLSTTESMGMSDCYVELAFSRKKSKVTVSAAPPNSVESGDLGAIDDIQEVRFSQSDVQVGFPEDVSEVVTTTEPPVILEGPTVSDVQRSDGAFAFANAMLGITAEEEVAGKPIIPEQLAEIVSSVVDKRDLKGGGGETAPVKGAKRMVPGSKEEAVALKLRYDNRQRMIQETAATQLLQEVLAKSDPNLVSVFTFMNKVCDTNSATLKFKKAAVSAIPKGRNDPREGGATDVTGSA